MDLNQGAAEVTKEIQQVQKEVKSEVMSRAHRITNALKNAQLQVFTGTRSGRVYKKSGTYGKKASKETKSLSGQYGHKLRGGQLYRASAPGEVPANRSQGGGLRQSFRQSVKTEGSTVIACLEAGKDYAGYLEGGTKRIAKRPFVERIKQQAKPEIDRILKEPYV